MPCIDDKSGDYDDWRRISNARFDLRPTLICRCTNDKEVGDAIMRARPHTPPKLPIRIRAGGHHHEGMCSGDDVMMIDVSPMANIDVDTNSGIARVGPGAKNGDIYDALWYAPRGPHRVFAGGGCGDVRVGGFIQGGGWGLYSRLLGMSCDRVAGFRIVMRDGKAYEINETDKGPNHDLYWAVCGAGGGNFGVVTEYRIKTFAVEKPLSTFTVSWDDRRHCRAVIREWCENFPDRADVHLTSFCRVSTPDTNDMDPPVLIGGYCMAGADDVVRMLEGLLEKTIASASTISVSPVHNLRAAGFTHPEYQPGPPPAALRAVAGGAEPNLGETCAGHPFPHKVSSCFPTARFGEAAIEAIVSYIDRSTVEPMSRRYLSLHAMGGAIRNPAANCFAWRDKSFMLQYQAWWIDPKDEKLGDRCMEWLRTFRTQMRTDGYTEGAFINFPDIEIPIADYYRDKYSSLRTHKTNFDIDGDFDFPMGIQRW